MSPDRRLDIDAVTIPRMIKVLSEEFDPAGRRLLFCESSNLCLWPCYGLGSIVQSGKKFIGVGKDAALLRRPLRGMPVGNTLTLLRLALIRYAVFEEWPNTARSQRVLPELPLEIERDPLAYEHVHHGLGV